MKTVSIVIPTFNRAKLLERAIESSLNQTYPCEIVVCDHGSRDHTPEVADRFGNRIRYIRRSEDRGPIICWRDGIEQATGEIVHIAYDDDWMDPTFIQKTVAWLHDDVAFVYSNVRIHYEGREHTKIAFKHPHNVGRTEDILRYLLFTRGPISPSCAIFRRSDALKNLLSEIPEASGVYGRNSGVGEDLLLFMLTALDYPNYVFIPEPLAHFFAHPGSITISAGARGQEKELFDAYKNARRYFRKYSHWSEPNLWEDFCWFFRWNYRSGTLAKQIRRNIRYFLQYPFQNIYRKREDE